MYWDYWGKGRRERSKCIGGRGAERDWDWGKGRSRDYWGRGSRERSTMYIDYWGKGGRERSKCIGIGGRGAEREVSDYWGRGSR